MDFEFDREKSAANHDKHGIDFIGAQAIWMDERMVTVRSKSEGEVRYLAIGLIGQRHWSAVWTERGPRLRIISARRSRKDEVELWLNGP